MCRRIVLASLAALTALPSLAGTVIELQRQALVHGRAYRLSDIARIDSDDAAMSRSLAEMEIGIAPHPGHSDRISRSQVGRVIEARMPELRGKLQWSGSKASTVRAAGVEMETQRLVRIAATFLRAGLEESHDRIEIKPVGSVRALMLPTSAELRLRPLDDGTVSRRMPVWIDIYADGHPYGAVPVWFAVQAWKSVPVAQRDLEAGSVLKAEDFRMAQIDVARSSKILHRLPLDGEARLRNAVRRGSPLTEGALETVPAISRNQAVAVRIEAGYIAIEAEGIALANGRIGETVKVKNPGSSEIFLATVLEPGVVSVNAR